MTKQQIIIQRLLDESERHPTAEELYLEARRELPNLSIGTVYRNLGQLADQGKIRRLHIPGQPDRFDKTSHPHDHAVCVRCGAISDVNRESLQSVIEEALHMDILSYELSIECVCSSCQGADC